LPRNNTVKPCLPRKNTVKTCVKGPVVFLSVSSASRSEYASTSCLLQGYLAHKKQRPPKTTGVPQRPPSTSCLLQEYLAHKKQPTYARCRATSLIRNSHLMPATGVLRSQETLRSKSPHVNKKPEALNIGAYDFSRRPCSDTQPLLWSIQGHLAHKKQRTPSTLLKDFCLGPCGGPGGGAVSCERGNPVGFRLQASENRVSKQIRGCRSGLLISDFL